MSESEEIRKRLIELGAEALADLLLDLAVRDEKAAARIQRELTTPDDNVKRVRARFAGLKRMRRFVHWRESAEFAEELRELLEDLGAIVRDPFEGAKLVGKFFEADEAVLGNSDDSSGHIGDLFRHDAPELFARFAAQCADPDQKAKLADLVYVLNSKDDYGVRDSLVAHAASFLPEPLVRELVERFESAAKAESDDFRKRHWWHLVESLARQLRDAPLFERTRLASWGRENPAACLDIATVHFEAGDPSSALKWLQRVPEKEVFQQYERERLLLRIYASLGETEKQREVAWRIFRTSRSGRGLEELLAVIGEERREPVIEREVRAILDSGAAVPRLSYSDARFLIDVGRMDAAESYLLEHASRLNGDYYGELLQMAEAMEAGGRMLVATLIYRALLDSILRRAQSRIYSHGARYLQTLDRLAPEVGDWRGFLSHDAYRLQLRQAHARKSAFWARVAEE